ncbi:flagellar hook protein FlgE [Pseudodesulfovibrio sp.]|uniref:flagellar hook protein FlgE n=1 Tax=unclassified Pseudodesulfovibrio TaxID=2661612 RepID=UPI003B0078C3
MGFGSLYTGATGLLAHADKMQVVSNNLANVSTIGYKKSDAQFCDLMSTVMAGGGAQYPNGAIGTSQIGMGVGMAEIRNIFLEGGRRSTDSVTDIAIAGNGFYGVRDAEFGTTRYTRAGAFHFNNDAYLVDPSGYRLQGHQVDRETGQISSSVSDVRLPYEDIVVDGENVRVVRSKPKATSNIQMFTRLDALATGQFNDDNNPFFAMFNAYDGSASSAGGVFGGQQPAYSSSLDVYDADGNAHELTVYFDPVNTNGLSNATPGYTYWEYLVALPPDSDGSGAYGTSAAGIAGTGVLVFDGTGKLVNMSAFSPGSASGAGGKDLAGWSPSTFSDEGLPQFDFTFGSNGSSVGTAQSISYDFGIKSTSSSWASGAGSAAAIGKDASMLLSMDDIKLDINRSTNYDSGSATLFQDQNGYAWGYLQNMSISREGILSGHFTNGQTEDLYAISIYNFTSEWGLRRDGSNNFVETDASGAAREGLAGTAERGVIEEKTLEESNVDMADEFANMILTQRGYQANSKIITTSDSLLNTTINIKR